MSNLAASIPVVIICFNNHVLVEHTISQLRALKVNNIIVIDNASTWDDTQSWLKFSSGFELIANEKNYGHNCWQQPDVYNKLPTFFCVTDPDLLFNSSLPENFLEILLELSLSTQAQRVGFALDISDGDLMFQDRDYHRGRSIVEWESQFWQQRVGHPTLEIYFARIDTTFHLFNKLGKRQIQLRLGGEFAAKHLPWYLNDPVFGHKVMLEVCSRSTHISTISKLRLRYQAQLESCLR